MRLRPATLDDLALLQRWDEQPHVIESDPNDDWAWEDELPRTHDWREQLVAEIDGRAIGFVQIIDPAREETHYWGDCADNLRAIDIWIGDESDLGRGFGTRMMELAIERCFSAPDVEAILIDPLASNTRARQFYARLGFRFIEQRRFGHDDCAVYRLDRAAWSEMVSATRRRTIPIAALVSSLTFSALACNADDASDHATDSATEDATNDATHDATHDDGSTSSSADGSEATGATSMDDGTDVATQSTAGTASEATSAPSETTDTSSSTSASSETTGTSSDSTSASSETTDTSSDSTGTSNGESTSGSESGTTTTDSDTDDDVGLLHRGVTLAGAEFGEGNLPGTFGVDYIYPNAEEVAYFSGKGMNTFRLPFRWERLQPQLGQVLDAVELQRIDDFVQLVENVDGYVVLDPHNYARYHGDVVGGGSLDNADLADLWDRLAEVYGGNDHVLFGIMNEPHDMPTEQWVAAANAAIAAIRDRGADNLLLVPGNAWTGAHSWAQNWYGTPNADAMQDIVDPADHWVVEVHQYLDADSSGVNESCVSTTIGTERVAEFAAWLELHGLRGFLGEFGGGRNSTCYGALDDLLTTLESDPVWMGWTYWAAGPWWGEYMFTLEPSMGVDRPQMDVLEQHLP